MEPTKRSNGMQGARSMRVQIRTHRSALPSNPFERATNRQGWCDESYRVQPVREGLGGVLGSR